MNLEWKGMEWGCVEGDEENKTVSSFTGIWGKLPSADSDLTYSL